MPKSSAPSGWPGIVDRCPTGTRPDVRSIIAIMRHSARSDQWDGQLEYLPAIYNAEPERMPDDVKLDGIRKLVEASGIPVHYGADKPCYYPGPDKGMLPPYSAFNTDDDFVSTLGHELVHATGHEDRLARKFNAKIFKEAYATEELVAELGSPFLCAHLGYSYIEAQSPAYLESWLKVLKADSRVTPSRKRPRLPLGQT